MAAGKRKSVSSAAASRGVALIEAVIAELEQRASSGGQKQPAGKVPAAEDLEAMRLGGGAPLPPSLVRFLTYHGAARDFPGLFVPDDPRSSLRPRSIEELVREVFPADMRSYFDLSPLAEALPGRCHPLGFAPPIQLLYVGVADEHGEYPVLTLQDYDDVLDVVFDYPGIDLFLACRAKVVERPRWVGGIVEHPAYGEALKQAVKRNCKPMPRVSQKQYRFAAALV